LAWTGKQGECIQLINFQLGVRCVPETGQVLPPRTDEMLYSEVRYGERVFEVETSRLRSRPWKWHTEVYSTFFYSFGIRFVLAGDGFYSGYRSKAFAMSIYDRIVRELPKCHDQDIEWRKAVETVFEELVTEGIFARWTDRSRYYDFLNRL